ncbi:MAG TPA: hypothetical protein PK536_09290 [Ignavibacteria bacterium]|nr:hypothetical protein [Bacteroidota bacterium]HRI85624.1 hypothetical protein [Ignavibacteria bacterium]HRJ99710.1 hypothetical protein [Ignavibacteria bacterium]
MNSGSQKIKNGYLLLFILLLTMISAQIVSDRTIQTNVERRINIQDSIESGLSEAPYQFRVVKTILGNAVELIVSKFEDDPEDSHIISYHIVIFLVFFGIYTLLFYYLRMMFSDKTCMIGLLLLQLIIPLGITSIWEEGDYITLLFYLVGFILMFKHKDQYLPLVVFIGTFNRDQIIFLGVFYVAFLIWEKRLFTKRSIAIIIMFFIAYFAAYMSLRIFYGFRENKYVTDIQTSTNIAHWDEILGLWIEQVFVFVILSAFAFKKSSLFFKLSLLSLILYVGIFFFNSILSQIAKILPAYLILIPMSLQILSGERMKYFDKLNSDDLSAAEST